MANVRTFYFHPETRFRATLKNQRAIMLNGRPGIYTYHHRLQLLQQARNSRCKNSTSR